MKSILTKISMGLLCASLAAAPATAAIERAPKAKAATETTTTATHAVATAASHYSAAKLSRAEKREARQTLRKALRADDDNLIVAVLITILIGFIGPAIGMYIHEGEFNNRVLISLILGLLGHLPGVIYNLVIFFGNSSKK